MIYRAIFITCVMLATLVAFSVYDSVKWQEFSQLHECVTVSKTNGYYITSPTYNVALKTWTTSQVWYPGHTQYKCNDGKEYTR